MLTTFLSLTTATLASTADGEPGFWFKTWLGDPTRSPVAGHSDSTFMYIWWFCVVWFIFLMGLMFYFVIAFRRKPGKIAQRSSSHNTPLEIIWTIVPTLMLVHIFWIGFEGYMEKVTPPGNAMELKVTGYRWSWDMEYPGGVVVNRGTSTGKVARDAAETIPIFYIPADTPIRLRLSTIAGDVMHAFWVPNFRVKTDLVPNRYTGMWFQASLPASGPTIKYHPKSKEEENLKEQWNNPYVEALAGEPFEDHWIFCAEYCGTGHSEMAGIIRVVSAGTYKKWLQNQADPADLKPWERGARIYKARCISCHSVDGSSGTGPTWKNSYGYEHTYTDGSTIVADDNHLIESIRYPNRHIRSDYPAGGMSAFPESLLSNKQLEYVIEYMKTLSDKAPATTPEETQKPAEPAAAAPAEKK